MLLSPFHLKCYLIYVILNFFLAIYIYFDSKKYYENPPKSKNLIEREINYDTEIHEKYPEWNRLDKLSFPRILFGLIFLFWTKFILLNLILVFIVISLKCMRIRPEEKETSLSKRKLLTKFNNFIFGLSLFIIGFRAKRVQRRYDEIYKKYLGSDYQSSFDDNYSIIISNHFSWIEILYYLQIYSPGFISKESVKNFPLIGTIASTIDCLFIDRTNSENRSYVVYLFFYVT
jgi:hypothetical protein